MREAWGSRRSGAARLLAILAVLAPLVAPIAAADYVQESGSAQRNGVVQGNGPSGPDVAWTIGLPGSKGFGPPLFIDRQLYVLVNDLGLGEGLDENALLRIDPDTANVTTLVDLPPAPRTHSDFVAPWPCCAPYQVASNGAIFYVIGNRSLEAFDMDARSLWRWEEPRFFQEHDVTHCEAPAVAGPVVVAHCLATARGADAAGTQTSPSQVTYVVALDAAMGEQRWLWVRDAKPTAVTELGGPEIRPLDPCVTAADTSAPAGCASGGPHVPAGIGVFGPYVVATSFTAFNQGSFSLAVHALDLRSGEQLWHRGVEMDADLEPPVLGDLVPFSRQPAGTETGVFVTLGDLFALNPANNDVLARRSVGARDSGANYDIGAGFAYDGGSLYASSHETISRFDSGRLRILWNYTLAHGSHEVWASSGPILAGDTLYARTTSKDRDHPASKLYAFDSETGEVRWTTAFNSTVADVFFTMTRQHEFSVDGDLIAVHGMDGNLTLLGRTAASLVPEINVSVHDPRVGEAIEADLSGTAPGLFGPATAYRADWGDGVWTPWQDTPVLTHIYEENGTTEARFQVRNDAGQTSTASYFFAVGAERPTLLEQAFSRENQEATFFVLGLALTGSGALIGVARLRRKRGRFERELQSIEAAYEHAGASRVDTEDALRERRTRVHGLLLDGKLDEAQVALLDKRIDELTRATRLSRLDERFDFLPYRMVRMLRSMLEDGRVTDWEHEHFVAVLERDELLTTEQRAHVREMIDDWFGRDQPS